MGITISELLEQAKGEVKNVKAGQKFLVKDLFKGHLWNSLPAGDRIQLGMRFFEYAHSDKGNIEVGGKTPSNQQSYTKK